ncbi:MAG: hypothetical protein ABI893_04900 [Polaromonas sp.]|uniref:hypothetical protein n=1 Tax=Polaromonas sp. TaxID=1869339 RepID=UPI003267184F
MQIAGETTQARSGKVISYRVEYERDGTTGRWTGQVLLRHGKWFDLKGGNLIDVGHGSIAPAVIQAFHGELESLDFEQLNSQMG